jgi:hypothetical protein
MFGSAPRQLFRCKANEAANVEALAMQFNEADG